MIIKFDNIPEKITPNFRGGEKEVASRAFDDGKNKIVRNRLIPGASVGLHTHETDSETMYILQGNGKVIYDGESFAVEAGDCHYCPKGHSHTLINDSEKDLVFFAVIPQQ